MFMSTWFLKMSPNSKSDFRVYALEFDLLPDLFLLDLSYIMV